MNELSGKLILVLGASSSIGLSLCDILIKQGASLVTQGNKNVSNIRAEFKPIAYEFNEKNLDEFCFQLKNFSFDGVVMLLGKTDFTYFSNMTMEKWNDVMFTNLSLPAMLIAKLSKQLNENASIVFCSSALAKIGENGMSHYSAAKAALLGLTVSLAKEFAHKKIRVNTVVPHLIETKNTNKISDKQKEIFKKRTLLKRLGKASDVSAAITFFLSSNSAFITAQQLDINAGSTIT